MKFTSAFIGLLGFLGSAKGFGTLCGHEGKFEIAGGIEREREREREIEMPSDLRIAFIGDAGHESGQEEVLSMIKSWGASAVIHSGDFEYSNDPEMFESQINKVLGADFPYFASIGNHDLLSWNGHKQRLEQRLLRSGADRNCSGEIGVNMACDWNGLFFVLSGAGTRGSGHVQFADQAFSSSNSPWKVASWHKNQRLMQIGGKFDETGWEIYDIARKHGAILATGHEHSYCRSHLMSDFEDQVIASTNSSLNLGLGQSFVFVSGLGGKDIRDWNDRLIQNPWWAAYGASDNGIKDGALLCIFNVAGNLRKAHCTFKDTSGKVWDDFDVFSSLPTQTEERLKALKEVETKEESSKKCKSKWIEIPVTHSKGDFQELEGKLISHSAKTFSFTNPSSVQLNFDDIPLQKGDVVRHAYLQVYGAESDENTPDLSITALSSKISIPWREDDEDWEIQNVWVSPDLRDILNEMVKGEEWRNGSPLSIKVSGKGKKSFYSFDESPCLSPTLVLEVEGKC